MQDRDRRSAANPIADDLKMQRSQRGRILALLRERGSAGVTNLELYGNFLPRHGARIFELRRMGYQIERRRESAGIFRFILRSEPTSAKPLPVSESPSEKFTTLPLFASGQSVRTG